MDGWMDGWMISMKVSGVFVVFNAARDVFMLFFFEMLDQVHFE